MVFSGMHLSFFIPLSPSNVSSYEVLKSLGVGICVGGNQDCNVKTSMVIGDRSDLYVAFKSITVH
jgi:hypothetical protein